jgi:tetrapyrrole methylase family protein / MazG family protein
LLSVIHVVGLGPGDMSSLPLGTLQQLQSGKPLFFRTFVHPVAGQLLQEGLQAESFDDLYETGDSFETIYQQMAENLFRAATQHGEIVYAVPGHPLMAEQSVQNLLNASTRRSVEVAILSGQSFVDAVCVLLSVDPIDGLSILDGTALDSQRLNPTLHTLIVQVFDRKVASEVKLTLMEVFPDDYLVTVVRAAGVRGEERRETVPLHELDRVLWIDHLTTVYIPPSSKPEILKRDPWQVVNLVRRLREPGGCPWDRKQTHKSLRPYVLEEAYEVAEAIDNEDDFALTDELGDLFLQVLLHAQIGAEEGSFDVRDVFGALADKLIRRHPHVFGEEAARSLEEAEQFWQAAKSSEVVPPTATPSPELDMQAESTLFSKVKWSQPPIATSLALQKAAADIGFDWPDIDGVFAKIREETDEVAESLKRREAEPGGVTDEFGDLVFTVVNLARWLQVDVDTTLNLANRKFLRRILTVEKILQKSGQDFGMITPQQLDFYWNQSKGQEKTLPIED